MLLTLMGRVLRGALRGPRAGESFGSDATGRLPPTAGGAAAHYCHPVPLHHY